MSRYRTLAILLILLHMLLATAYSLGNPLGEAPDEADHWAYVLYLARERALPEGPRVTQSKHPPFYHASAAIIASLADPSQPVLRSNPDIAIHPGPTQSPNFFIHTTQEALPWHHAGVRAFHFARIWSIVLSTATVAAVYALARSALPTRPGIALLATGLAATLPEFAFIGSSINNDNAAALFGTLALWGGFAIYQARGNWRAGWWTPLVLGLGFLSKASILALWPIVGLCILLGVVHHPSNSPISWRAAWRAGWQKARNDWQRWIRAGLIVFLPATLISAPWIIRNWQLYGDPSGMALAIQTIDVRTAAWTWSDTLWLLRGWFFSFWGKFGAVGQIPFPTWIYWALGALTFAALVGVIFAWIRWQRDRVAILLLGMAAIGVATSMWRYSLVALGTDQGRLLFPALGPLLLLMALGLAIWPPVRLRFALGSTLIGAIALLSMYGLLGVIQPAFAPPPPPTTEEVAQAILDDTPLEFGEITLQGWTLDGNPILYWHANQAPTQDWRALLRVTTEDGTLVWEWRRSPGYGRYSTDHWAAGTTLRDEYAIQWPDWAGPGRYRVEVTLYPFGEEPSYDASHTVLGWLDKGT